MDRLILRSNTAGAYELGPWMAVPTGTLLERQPTIGWTGAKTTCSLNVGMAETGHYEGATSTYSAPLIEDYGSLTDLTASFDPDMVASFAQGAGGLSLAVVSAVLPDRSSSSSSTVLEKRISGGGGSSRVLDERISGGGGGGSSGGGGAGAGGGGTGDPSGAGGRLPFSGYAVFVTAAVGAGLASAGAGTRAALRRRQS